LSLPDAADLERLFARLFLDHHGTVLVGGADEPLYLPARGRAPAEIRYREDFAASALHEVAHWCIAGAARRATTDYGYWYAPGGRGADAQREFERVEIRPQAIESILARSCGLPFRVSLDNPGRDELDPAPFEARVAAEAQRLERSGLPPRATRFRDALARQWGPADEARAGTLES